MYQGVCLQVLQPRIGWGSTWNMYRGTSTVPSEQKYWSSCFFKILCIYCKKCCVFNPFLDYADTQQIILHLKNKKIMTKVKKYLIWYGSNDFTNFFDLAKIFDNNFENCVSNYTVQLRGHPLFSDFKTKNQFCSFWRLKIKSETNYNFGISFWQVFFDVKGP